MPLVVLVFGIRNRFGWTVAFFVYVIFVVCVSRVSVVCGWCTGCNLVQAASHGEWPAGSVPRLVISYASNVTVGFTFALSSLADFVYA